MVEIFLANSKIKFGTSLDDKKRGKRMLHPRDLNLRPKAMPLLVFQIVIIGYLLLRIMGLNDVSFLLMVNKDIEASEHVFKTLFLTFLRA